MPVKTIKEALDKKRLVIGTRTVLKCIKRGEAERVFYASNCPDEMINDLEHYAKTSKISVEGFEKDSVKLGQMCGKPFNVLLVGIKKQ